MGCIRFKKHKETKTITVTSKVDIVQISTRPKSTSSFYTHSKTELTPRSGSADRSKFSSEYASEYTSEYTSIYASKLNFKYNARIKSHSDSKSTSESTTTNIVSSQIQTPYSDFYAQHNSKASSSA